MKIIRAKFLKRINRFVCEVNLKDKNERVYLANSGRLREILEEGNEVILSPKRGKLPYKLVGVKKDNVWISTDAHLVNRFFENAVNKGEIEFLKGWEIKQREKKTDHSRIDFILKKGKKIAFCEIKSCTLVINKIASFPDAPTKRGVKHIETLIRKKKEGYESFIIFIAQREDAKSFAPNSQTHPGFSKSLYRAIVEGVKVYLIITEFDHRKIDLRIKSWKKLEIFDILKNEFHLWRYPEVIIKDLIKIKDKIYIKMQGTTCFHCSFEENLFDFIEFAKERGISLKIDNIKSKIGELEAKLLWRF